MKFDPSLIPVVLASIAPPIIFLFVIFWDRRQRRGVEKPPQVEKLLRPPGYSLANRLDESLDAILLELFKAFFLGSMSGSSAFAAYHSLIGHAPVLVTTVFIVLLVLFTAACAMATRKAIQIFHDGRKIRLGLRGEQAVAEALGEAADSGFRAFHDIPGGDNWNIDHVAVGTRGVFLIETKARSKRAGYNNQPAHEVIFTGDFLQFPTGKDTKSLEQAKRNAAWFSDYLRKKTGEPVRVEPLVVLPGWFVRIAERGNFAVKAKNTNYLVRFLAGQTEIIPPAQVRRIITALDEKCRDVDFN